MRVCMMLEGQESISWQDWLVIAEACERHGFDGLFTSDHYGSVQHRPHREAFDAWTVLGGVATRTHRLRLGTLVSPATFRHPSVLAKAATTADHISGGRIELGMGAGWLEHEHRSYGFDFPAMGERMTRLSEQLEIIHRQWTEDRFDFAGKHYTLTGCEALPKPAQKPHPPLILGGLGGPRSAALAARWADEYNLVSTGRADVADRVGALRQACSTAGRDASTLRISVMSGVIVGASRAEVVRRAVDVSRWTGRGDDGEAFLSSIEGRWFAGTIDEVIAQIGELAEVGIQRVFLQTLNHEDTEMIELIGRDVVPEVAGMVSA